jgi:hypothetical protein
MTIDLDAAKLIRYAWSGLWFIHREYQVAYLRLDQDQIYEENNKVMLDIFVGKAFAVRALC